VPMQLPPDAVERVLDTWPVARLATRAPSGPHQVPVVFARSAGLLWTPVDGKPKGAGELARVRHVRAHPEVSLLLDHYDEDWERLWWLRVDGLARVVQPADPEGDPEVSAAVAALRAKYPQYQRLPVLREPPTLLRVRPRALRSWCAARWEPLS
jgi:PPOX class probable F420-dependent enzyme